MKKERLIIAGHSASGKDYLSESLVKMGLKKSVTYTTRPIRNGEVDGEVYHFVSLDEFNIMESNNLFYEFEDFKVDNGYLWYYGSTNEDWDKCNLFIKTVRGINEIRKEDRDSCFIVFLDIPKDVRYQRLLERNDNNDSVNRRIESDEKDFDGFLDYDLKIIDEDFDPQMVFDLMD